MLEGSIYRNGGDEFVAIIDGDKTEDHIRNLAGFIHRRFNKPWQLRSGTVFCNVSIGVARYPEDGRKVEELLLKADQAMYRVKKPAAKAFALIMSRRIKKPRSEEIILAAWFLFEHFICDLNIFYLCNSILL